jgi:4a-hydroxytetrahydrobiopterin dehydratase
MDAYDPKTIQDRLAALPGWVLDGGDITRTYDAGDFNRAMGFVVRIALLAEVADHHPDIHIAWNRVGIRLSTHSAQGITQKDFDLAARIDAAFGG